MVFLKVNGKLAMISNPSRSDRGNLGKALSSSNLQSLGPKLAQPAAAPQTPASTPANNTGTVPKS